MDAQIEKLLSHIRTVYHDEGGHTELVRWLLTASDDCKYLDEGLGDPVIEVRLRYYEGTFFVSTGAAACEQDHRGYWGDAVVGPHLTHRGAHDVATDLLEQVLESAAEDAVLSSEGDQ